MEPLPQTMRALVAPRYCGPDGYEIATVPVPQIKAPDEVLIRIHAASIFFGDATGASGRARMLMPVSFPAILGREGSGTVAAIGSAVTTLRVGDSVYGTGLKHPMAKLLTDGSRGWCAEYAVTTADLLLRKPDHLSFEDAAGVLANTVTAIQLSRAAGISSLEGKTVLVTAGLGSSSSIAAQYAKNVLGAREVIATVSTAKVPLLEQYMPGVVDRAVDYQKEDVVSAVGKRTVDVLYNARPEAMALLPTLKKGGILAAIVAVPTSATMQKSLGKGVLPFWVRWGLDLFQWYYRWKLWWVGARMVFLSADMGARKDVERAGELIALGKIRRVHTVVPFEDLEDIRKGCMEAMTLKGRIGKLVIKII